MGAESKPWLIWWAVAASAAVHAGAAAGVVALPAVFPTGEASMTSEVDIVMLDAPIEEAMPVRADEHELREPLPSLEPRDRREEPEARPRLATLVPSTVVNPTTERPLDPRPIDEPDPREDDERDRDRRPRVSLDPASVAAGAVVYETGPTPRGPRVDSSPTDRETEDALEGALEGALSAAANARPHVSRRPPPRLRPRRDGSYIFHGHIFDAVIARDGTVQFADRGNVGIDTPSVDRPDGLLPSGTFDLGNAIESARGQDPHRHERAWFMRETRELRQRLEDQASEGERDRGIARFNGDLRRILRGPGTARERRAQIFSLWDGCTEDEVGARARAAVVAFVRRHLPREGRLAYPAGELAALNRQRLSREPFQPYPR